MKEMPITSLAPKRFGRPKKIKTDSSLQTLQIPARYYVDNGQIKVDFEGDLTEEHYEKINNYQKIVNEGDHAVDPNDLSKGFRFNPAPFYTSVQKRKKPEKQDRKKDFVSDEGQKANNEETLSIVPFTVNFPIPQVAVSPPIISPKVLKNIAKTSVINAHPSSLAQMIGQRRAIEQIDDAIKVAKKNGTAMDHMQIGGPPGVGKSIIARAAARDLNVPYRATLGSIKRAELNNLLLNLEPREILHIDEAHELVRPSVNVLLSAVLDKKVYTTIGKQNVPLPINDFTLILSTTDIFSLDKALQSRMMLNLTLSTYSELELCQIAEERCKKLDWDFDPAILPEIATRAQGIPRLALRILQAAWRVCDVNDAPRIELDHLKRAMDLEGLDSIGLTPEQQQYLKILQEGSARLSTIAQRINTKDLTVSRVMEPYLIQCGFISRDNHGLRSITPIGIKHICKADGGVQ